MPKRKAPAAAVAAGGDVGKAGVAAPSVALEGLTNGTPRTAEAHTVPSDGGPKPRRPPTHFERRLYAATQRVPAGSVTTYGELAKALGTCARAVGSGMRRNPFAPVVPCHRVVASTLDLGGFDGQWGAGCANVARKRRLLEGEGVSFDEAGRVERRHLMTAAQLGVGAPDSGGA
jgi:methylated-DNA-[protein]-cysteine S-methyltransferase